MSVPSIYNLYLVNLDLQMKPVKKALQLIFPIKRIFNLIFQIWDFLMQSSNAERAPYFEGKVNDTAQFEISEIHFLSYIKSILVRTY